MKLRALLILIVEAICCSAENIYCEQDDHPYLSPFPPTSPIRLINGFEYEQVIYHKSHPFLLGFYTRNDGNRFFLNEFNALVEELAYLENVLSFGAVDCSLPYNIRMCQHFDIVKNHTIKYFRENSPKGNGGDELPLFEDKARAYKFSLLRHIAHEQFEGYGFMLPRLASRRNTNRVNFSAANFVSDEDYLPDVRLNPKINVITAKNFHTVLYNQPHVIYVLFYQSTCRICLDHLKKWNYFSDEFAAFYPRLTFGVINCFLEKDLCAKFPLRHLPSSRYFHEFSSNGSSGQEMDCNGEMNVNKDKLLRKIMEEQNLGRGLILPNILPFQDYIPYNLRVDLSLPLISSGKTVFPNYLMGYDGLNFKYRISNKPYVNIILFYCSNLNQKDYLRIWGNFAWTMKRVKHLIKYGIVDCSNLFNRYVCKKFNVKACPTIKYISEGFGENSPDFTVPTPANILSLKEFISNQILDEQRQGRARRIPTFLQYEHATLEELRIFAKNRLPILLLEESEDTSIGALIAMELIDKDRLYFRYSVANCELNSYLNVTRFPQLYVLDFKFPPRLQYGFATLRNKAESLLKTIANKKKKIMVIPPTRYEKLPRGFNSPDFRKGLISDVCSNSDSGCTVNTTREGKAGSVVDQDLAKDSQRFTVKKKSEEMREERVVKPEKSKTLLTPRTSLKKIVGESAEKIKISLPKGQPLTSITAMRIQNETILNNNLK